MAKKPEKKTNAMRMLDQVGIAYEVLLYDCGDGSFDGRRVAEQVGLAEETVFKTLVTWGSPGEVAVCCIPVSRRLDLKTLAAAAGVKRLEMVEPGVLQGLTGYIRGGVSPVGMKKAFPTFLDRSAFSHPKIAVSAGIRGKQLLLSPDHLSAYVHAVAGEFAAEE